MRKHLLLRMMTVLFALTFGLVILGLSGKLAVPNWVLGLAVGTLLIWHALAAVVIFKSADFLETDQAVGPEGWNLLATLWKQQAVLPGNALEKRGHLAISPESPQFREYARGLFQLYRLELVVISGHDYRVSLSDKGRLFCRQHEPRLARVRRLFHAEQRVW